MLKTVSSAGGGGVTGSGATNYVAKFTTSTSIGVSIIYDNGTNVGIGTTPTEKLDIGGAGSLIHMYRAVDGSGTCYLGSRSGSGFSLYNASGATSEIIAEGNYAAINTFGSERMRVTSGGNVGIGTTAPIAGLTSYSSAQQAGFFQKNVGQPLLTSNPLLPKNPVVCVVGDSTSNENYPGSIGLITFGLTDATRRGSEIYLVSSRSTNTQWNAGTYTPVTDGDVTGRIMFCGDNGVTLRQYSGYIEGRASETWSSTSTAGYISFFTTASGNTASTERMRILANGNIGINDSSPTERLQVDGKLLLNNGASSYFDAQAGKLVITHPTAATLEVNSAERMRIDSSGNVGIGTSSPAKKLDVSGDAIIRTTTGFNTQFTQPIGGGGISFVSTTDPTAVDQRLFSLAFGSSTYTAQARVEAFAAEAWSATNLGTYLVFRTTPIGGTVSVEKMRIGPNGNITYSGTIVPRVTESSTYSSWSSYNTDVVSITAQTGTITVGADSTGSTAVNGQKIIFRIVGGSGGCTVTFDSGASYKFKGIGVTLPSSTSVASGVTMMLGAIYNTNSLRWEVVSLTQG